MKGIIYLLGSGKFTKKTWSRERERGKREIRVNLENGEKEEGWLKDSCEDKSKGTGFSNSETFALLGLSSLGQN